MLKTEGTPGGTRRRDPDDPRTVYVPRTMSPDWPELLVITRMASWGWSDMWREAVKRDDGWYIRGGDFEPWWEGEWEGPVAKKRASAFVGQVQAAHRRAVRAWERDHTEP